MKKLQKVAVRNMVRGQVIIDPEGNEATVLRVRWIDHARAKLETDLGAATVLLNDSFPLA